MSQLTAARPRRMGLYVPLVVLTLLALGWTGLWLYGRHRVGLELDNFLARQASIGRTWSCPDRRIGGYPFRIDVACEKPSFASERRGRGEISGTLGRLTVTAQTAGALNLAHVIATFEGPFVVNEEGFGRTTTTWKSAVASYRGHPRRLERCALTMTEPATTLEPTGAQPMRMTAQSLEAHVREGVAPGEPGAYDVALRLNNAVLPPLDAALRTPDPVNLLLDGKLLNLGAIDRRDWRATVESWRNAGGAFRVEQFGLAKGAPRLEARGDLKLDALRRLEGRLDANFINAGPLLQQFGINMGGGAAGALLGGLLGGNRAANEPQRDRSLRLPLVLGDGRVSVGPFRVPGLLIPPLY
ncbi:MAG: DUF2125 domain-containing protein [Beijerinckiaceae bacterium]